MKQQQKQTGIIVFYSYAPADNAWRTRLSTHLHSLERDELIKEWSNQQILAGSDRAQEIDQALHTAHLILLLISADFLESDACYDIEMQQALERHRRGEARVIPIIVHPCDWQTSPFAHLQWLPRNAKPIATWENPDEAFATIAQELRRIIAQHQFSAAPLSSSQQKERTKLLKQVRDSWIKGLLNPPLQQASWIDLHLQEHPDALENPWRSQIQEMRREARLLPFGTDIVEVYDEANGELLILGEPGSGKTMLLCHLTRVLLDRAEADERLPIPAIFHLSSWAQKQESLATWLVEELETKYRVNRRIARHWVEANQVLPLLDGLDEVGAEARVACAQTIIDYFHQTKTPLVICCRKQEYQDLSVQVPLSCAVSILPLTEEQIDTYLSSVQGQFDGLRQALDQDPELAILAQRPLMLNIFALAYQGATINDFPDTSSSPEQTRHAIFALYVKSMLSRREKLPSWMDKHFLHWLIYVAKQLHQHHQTILQLEDIRPGWLPQKQERISRWIMALIFGLSFAPVCGLIGGWILGLAGILGGVLGGIRYIGRDIRIPPVEAITWSWEKAKKSLVSSLVYGLTVGLLGLLIGFLGNMLIGGLIFGLFIGLLIGLLCFMVSGLSAKQLTARLHLSPNEGIWRSMKYGLRIGLSFGLLGTPIFGIFAGLRYGLFGWLLIGPAFGLLSGLLFGLYSFVQHFLIRFFLWRLNYLPWDLVPFLDEAAERLFLRKVGGNYLFVHRLLLEYFTSLDEPTPTNHISTEEPGMTVT